MGNRQKKEKKNLPEIPAPANTRGASSGVHRDPKAMGDTYAIELLKRQLIGAHPPLSLSIGSRVGPACAATRNCIFARSLPRGLISHPLRFVVRFDVRNRT